MTPVWRLAHGRELTLDQPRLMAILNATPDSFSDGGLHLDAPAAIDYARQSIDEGAVIIDVGGESTRPGASRIDAAQQRRRVLPIIDGVARLDNVLISIDTTCAEVARAAIDAGAHIINDVSAGTEDASMLTLAAESGAGLILMHRLRPPDVDSYSDQYAAEPHYDDVVAEVRGWLADRANQAIKAGVAWQQIVIDPGLGFGKSVAQNFELIARVSEFHASGFPVLSAASRKSFIGRATGVVEPTARVSGSVAVTIHQFLAGARLFRVHDVRAHREALDVVQRIGGRA
jgi:dihydropteroate synthase